MLAIHPVVRPILVRAISLLLLVAVAASYSPVAAARADPTIASQPGPATSAALVVTVVGGSTFIPAPIEDALVTVHDARTGDKVIFGYTDPNGEVDFKLAPGTYMVAIVAEGRGSHMTESFTLVANQSHSITVVMNAAR